jgi:hypothetical protein
MARGVILAILLAASAIIAGAQRPASEHSPNWVLAPNAKAARYTFLISFDDRESMASLIPPDSASSDLSSPDSVADVTATIAAGPLRDQVAKAAAWLRIASPVPQARARLWVQANRPGGNDNPLDNLTSKAVTSGEWTYTEVMIGIAPDAETITFGVQAEGGARVEIRNFSFNGVSFRNPEPLSFRPRDAPDTDVIAEPPPITDLIPPDLAEKRSVVNAAARLALRYVRSLPDFLCTETIQRAENLNRRGWRPKDVLAIRVGFSGGVEHYRLLTIDGKPSNVPLRSLSGAETEGEFGTLEAELFQPSTAIFDWDHWALLRGRVVHVFRYTVKLEKSQFHLRYDGGSQQPLEQLVGYHGLVYIDRETSEVLRIDQIAEPPADFPLKESKTVLNYDHRDIGGQQFLLPIQAESYIRSATLNTHNVIEFRDYQKFSAEAKIEFE